SARERSAEDAVERRRQNAAETAERRHRLLLALRHTVAYNREVLADYVADLERRGSLQKEGLDLATLEGTATVKYELLDMESCRTIDGFRYQLSIVHRLFEGLFNVETDAWKSNPANTNS